MTDDLRENRKKDKYYNVKYVLKIYRFVLPTSEKFVEEAENYLKRRKQTKVFPSSEYPLGTLKFVKIADLPQ